MKPWLKKQLTNIVFLVLIIAAALTIYLLSRKVPPYDASAAQEEAPTAAPTPTRAVVSRGVPEAVFCTHLQTSPLYNAEESDQDGAWTLTTVDSPETAAQILYSVQNGCVSSLEVSIGLPKIYKDKGSTSIDQYLYESSRKQSGAIPDALKNMLADLLPACDAEDRLSVTVARYWAEQALLLAKSGDDFKDSQSGCEFVALRTEKDGKDVLICTAFFE